MELFFHDVQPVLELKQIKDIPPARYSREKVSLPFDGSNRMKNFMVPFMNTSKQEIARMMSNSHPYIKNTSMGYKVYYYNYKPIRTIIETTGTVVPIITTPQAKKKRAVDYMEYTELCSIALTPFNINAAHGKNIFYDYQPYIDQLINHPKIKKFPLLKKIDTFYMTLEKIIRVTTNEAAGYSCGPIMINLDEYHQQTSINKFHFVTYLLATMRRSQDFINRYKSDYKVILYTNKGYLLIDMGEDLKKEMLTKFKAAIRRLKPEVPIESIEERIEKEDIAIQVNNKIAVAFTGDTDNLPIPVDSEVVDKIVDSVTDKEDSSIYGKRDESGDEEEDTETIEEDKLNRAMQEVEMNSEVKTAIVKSLSNRYSGGEKVVSKRDALLREKQQKIQIHGKTIGELTKEIEIPEVESHTVSDEIVPVAHESIRNVKFVNLNRTYEKELRDKDIANILTMYNDKTIDMNVISVETKDTSDNLNLKETYKVTFEDELRRRHTISVNMPLFVDDNQLYLNGNFVVIQNQQTGLPVIKVSPDEVQICSNYNKIWSKRFGTKFNPNIERFKKFLVKDEGKHTSYVRGDNTIPNKGKLTCLEYDEMAKFYDSIRVNDCHFIFNVDSLHEILPECDSTLDKYIIGYRETSRGKEPLWYNKNNEDNVDLISTMINYSYPEYYDEFKKLSAGKKYVYTNSRIMEKWLPMIIIISFFEGITTVIKKFNDPRVTIVDTPVKNGNYICIPFSDCYIQYPMSDMEACLLFNGLLLVNTASYEINDLNDRQTYIDIFEELVGDGFIAGGLINFYDFMMDPITVELCESLGYPTDIVSLMIYANNLLADSQYNTDISLRNYRNRRNEVVQAILYKQMAIAYSRYRATARNNNPVKISVDPDCVIKNLQKVVTVGDYSKLSPIVEVRDRALSSMRGYAGMNLDDAYNQEKRSYDKNSMCGIIGVSTDNAKNCGKERHLVLEPNIMNARGMYKITDYDKVDELSTEQMVTAVELLNPGGLTSDDPVRTAMATKQRSHAIPVRNGCPLLVSTGMDTMIHYHTGNDFSVVAKDDGVVEDKDDKLGLMTVRYKDGSIQIIDISMKMAKAGGEGIYLRNKLSTSFKKGDKFRKDDILAFDKNYYKDFGILGNRLHFGTLYKSMIMSDSSTYEDSQWFTEKVSHNSASEITEKKVVNVGKNATVEFVRKVGEHVQVGDELMRFDTSYEDKELNRLLSGVREDLQETIIDLGKTKILSKVDGVIDQVLVYPSVPIDELSPSLQKYVKEYQSIDRQRMAYVNKIDPENKDGIYRKGCLLNKPTGVVATDAFGKIHGTEATDSVIFEFYITFIDEISDGDKLVHQNANKATECDMIPHGYEPYSEFRPYEEVSIIIAPSAILARGTPSINPTMLFYKALIELKRKHYKILTGEDWNEKQKRENPYMNHDLILNPVKESVEFDEPSELLERLFESNNVAFNGKAAYATTFYDPGDTVMECVDMDGLAAEDIIKRFKSDGSIKNVAVNKESNSIIATEMIYPSEPLLC